MHGYGFGIGFWWFFPLLFVAVLIYFFANTAKRSDREGNRALDILDERFAKGEIDQQEYDRRRDKLLQEK